MYAVPALIIAVLLAVLIVLAPFYLYEKISAKRRSR